MSESTSEPRRIRAGDADRDRVVAALQAHREAGRLTAEEFEERMETALMARWLDELPPLLSDLPGQGPEGGPGGPGRGWSTPRGGPGWGGDPGPAPQGWGPGPRGGFGCGPVRPWGAARFLMLLAPVFVVAALVGSVVAVASGHFPFPLLWLAAAAFWFRPWWRWRRHGWPGYARR